ncbi:hypothetical protein KCU81_g9844, partial [Aureobasidium melanogenum]
MAAEGRPLDLLERFQLAQARAGTVPYITIIGVILIPPVDLMQKLAEISVNIDELMRVHPILVAGIDDTDIRRPKWRPNHDNPPFESNGSMFHPIVESTVIKVQSIAHVVGAEEAEAQGFNLATGPLWRIGVYGLDNEPPNSYCVALTIHHIVTDGMGALALLEQVMHPPSTTSATSARPRQQPLPPKTQKTMRMQPSVMGTIRKGARWLLNHKMSLKVTQGLGATKVWPPSDLLKDGPRRADVGHISVNFGQDENRIVERLEALGHQIGSVHSVLHTAAVIALAAAVATGDDTFDTIGTETPMSLRPEARNAPRIGGNYTGMVERSIPIAKLKSETIASFTKKTNNYIHSREAKSDARSRSISLRQSKRRWNDKTYSSRDSHVVTHRSTNLPFNCLCMAERTGCPVFS